MFFKKGTQKFSNAKATAQTECHKCGKNGHFARDCWSKTSVPSYQSPFQSKLILSSENKPEPRQIKDFEAKYHKDDEEVLFDENEVTEVKALMALTDEERVSVGKESARNGDWTKISIKKKKILGIDQLTEDTSSSGPKDLIFVKSSVDNSNMSITSSNKPRLSEAEDSTLPNRDTVNDYDSALESQSIAPHSSLEKLIGVYQHHTGQGESSLRSRSSSYDHDTHGHNKIISLRRGIKPRNPQHVTKNCKTCGSNVHTITDHDDIEWFRKREALQAKKAETFKTSINYDKTDAPVARLKAIRIFLAFATYMNFIAYQMDFKSAFLNSKLKDVYVKQPPGFESSEFPNHVCKLSKALYGLKQAPRAWHFNQPNKYVKDLLRKYDINGSSVKTPMVPPNKLGPDLNGKAVNETQYRGMIRSLMYLTASGPDIQFSTYLYARYQANPTESHLIDVKRIFRKSTYDACPLLGGKLVCWSAKKHPYFAITSVLLQSQTIQFCTQEQSILISDIILLENHILIGDIELHFIPTQYQLADIFTKPLDEQILKRLIVELGILNIDSKPKPSVLTEEN
ncbi:retrovirus-related pol polyprotein from transposon TNT 1-94 [Tanacetum coccineum]